jgi:hypothetical protein
MCGVGPDTWAARLKLCSDRRLRPLPLDLGSTAASVSLGGSLRPRPFADGWFGGGAQPTLRSATLAQSCLPAQRAGSRYTVVDDAVGINCSSAIQSAEVPA